METKTRGEWRSYENGDLMSERRDLARVGDLGVPVVEGTARQDSRRQKSSHKGTTAC